MVEVVVVAESAPPPLRVQVTPSPLVSLATVAVKLKVPFGAMVAEDPAMATERVLRWPPLHPAKRTATQRYTANLKECFFKVAP